jgi:hypothetical protein
MARQASLTPEEIHAEDVHLLHRLLERRGFVSSTPGRQIDQAVFAYYICAV